VCIRLKRLGSKQRPFYRVVAAESGRATQGKTLELLGYFDPLAKDKPLSIDTARLASWRGRGADLSPSVARLAKRATEAAKA